MRRLDLAGVAPGLAMVGVAVIWATQQGGYFPSAWYPGAIALLAVLALTVAAEPRWLAAMPQATRLAIGALAAFTAWSYLSILWADAQGTAWEAANQTLTYLVAFVLLSRPLDGRAAAVVAGAWALAMTGLAIVVLLRLPEVVGGAPARFSSGMDAPFGYTNATAAAWMLAMWPALLLAACRDVAWWLRGAFAAAVVVLADTSVLSDSRGALIGALIVLAVLLAAVPGRVRTLLTLLPAGVAIAVTAPHLLDLSHAAEAGPAGIADLDGAAAPALLAALAAGLAVAAVGLLEQLRPPGEALRRDVRRGVAAAAVLVGAVAVVGGAVAAGDPVDRVRDTWREFKTTGTADAGPAGFGGARYDYYRVAFDLTRDHPLAGIGAGNFGQDYLERGRVGERPTSPHSHEIRALVQGGVVGLTLLLVALAAAFAAAWRGVTSGSRLACAAAAGGALAALHWVVQGSADFFWEFPGLAVPALGLLAIAGAVAPRRAQPEPGRPPWPLAAIAAVVALAAAASLAFPYAAERKLRSAQDVAARDPASAFAQLDRAADLNPLSEQPSVVAGTLALSLGQLARAESAFRQALERDPRNHYATLALGALMSQRGRRAEAQQLLARALRLAPADPPTAWAVEQARAGRVDVRELERRLAEFRGQLVQ